MNIGRRWERLNYSIRLRGIAYFIPPDHELMKAIWALKRGDCWCDPKPEADGAPPSHSVPCKQVQRVLGLIRPSR